MTRILYIDDEADIREVADLALGLDPDFDVRTAASGAEGISMAEQWAPDLILLDVMMPGMDGPATFRALHDQLGCAGIPVVFITARTQQQDVAALEALGARGVLAKPFDPMTLAAEVRGFLA